MKMKSERPLLIGGVPSTEFETNEHHGRELINAGLAVEISEKAAAKHDDKAAPAPANKAAATPKNK